MGKEIKPCNKVKWCNISGKVIRSCCTGHLINVVLSSSYCLSDTCMCLTS